MLLYTTYLRRLNVLRLLDLGSGIIARLNELHSCLIQLKAMHRLLLLPKQFAFIDGPCYKLFASGDDLLRLLESIELDRALHRGFFAPHQLVLPLFLIPMF